MADLTVAEVTVATQCKRPENVVTHWPILLAALKAKGAASRNSQIGLAATVSIETGRDRFCPIRENLNYGAPGLMQTFKRFFPTLTVANAYARQPERVANYVYANRFGNGDEESGDGWRYRGGGEIQLTFRDNYRDAGAAIGVDLEGDPERIMDPGVAAAASVWYWTRKGCPQACELADWGLVRELVNGPARHNLSGFLALIRRFGLAA
jgi:predicted chitinase